ncbi:MAG: glycosyltransferase family 2 protein [Bacteroidales bacterium]|nr:glycosyltransferase family 2 protein [Bacteroidales bacterium]
MVHINHKYLLSIIIPIYNIKEYIKSCIESAALLDSNLYEIVLIDDGSTDGVEKLIDSISLDYNNIKVLHQKNQGLSGARNSGLNLSQGKYIWFVDGDDYVDSINLNKAIEFLKNNNSDIVTFDMALGADRNSNYRSISKCCLIPERNYSAEESFRSGFIPTSACSAFYKKEFIDNFNLRFNICAYREDVEFTGRAFLLASKICYLPLLLYYYYEREGSITKNESIENRQKLIRAEVTIADSFNKFLSEYSSDYPYISKIMKERINLIVMNMMISLFHDKYLDYDFSKHILIDCKRKKLYPLNLRINQISFKRKIMWLFANFESLYFLLIKISRKKQ